MKKLIPSAALLMSAGMAHALVFDVVANMDTVQHGHSGLNGIGTMIGTYDDVTNLWTITSMTSTNLTGDIISAHLHQGAAGASGGVLIGLGSVGGGEWSGSNGNYTYVGPNPLALAQADEADFLNGLTYINLHTGQFPGGEVRGQVIATPIPEPATLTFLALGLAALARKRQQSK
ncbi:CHRD domain-containing protein [Kamptonema cortianum]|nr:CHRD domain-containing protein [Geitlerinema splendidum]MDK3156128.1 CHRD domain-containing protein [Kamptonema cortianum]